MQKDVNIQETDGGSVTVALPDWWFESTRRDLIALRVKHGADTPIGHRCSNLIEQIKSYRSKVARDDFGADVIQRLIKRSMTELQSLLAAR